MYFILLVMACRYHPGCTNEHCQGFIPLRECLYNLKIEAHVPDFVQEYSHTELVSMYQLYETKRKRHPVLRFVLDHAPSLGLNTRVRHDIAARALAQEGQDLSLLEIE